MPDRLMVGLAQGLITINSRNGSIDTIDNTGTYYHLFQGPENKTINGMELTKAGKKVAREIIEIGLQNEFKKGLQAAASIIHEWENTNGDNREYYHSLFLTSVILINTLSGDIMI